MECLLPSSFEGGRDVGTCSAEEREWGQLCCKTDANSWELIVDSVDAGLSLDLWDGGTFNVGFFFLPGTVRRVTLISLYLSADKGLELSVTQQ